MCTEKNSISENKDIHVHVPTCSNYTHIHETHSFGLVYIVLYSDCEHDYDKMTFNFFVDAHVINYWLR